MSGKNIYWIADTDGTKALVEGAEERDRWVHVHGWAETDEPTGQEFVWVHNENPELLPARMNWQAAQDPAWAARGWAPGAPVEPVNNAVAHRAAAEQPVPEPVKPIKSTAAGGDKKE